MWFELERSCYAITCGRHSLRRVEFSSKVDVIPVPGLEDTHFYGNKSDLWYNSRDLKAFV